MEPYVIATRELDHQRTITVVPLTFGRARLYVGDTGAMVFDDGW